MAGQHIHRANEFLNEAIEMLDQHLYRYNGDIKKAHSCLTKTEQEFVAEEMEHCVIDPRYYLENYHVIQTEDQGLRCLTPFWESQEIFYYEILKIQRDGKPVKILCLKARQQGLSELGAGLVFQKTIFTETCNSLIVAQDPGQSDFIFSKSRLAYDYLPWWMKPEQRYDSKGRYMVFDKKDDTERQLFPGLRSQFIVEAANKMGSVARGKTIRASHMSELSSWGDGGILAKSIFPTMNAEDELAILESTALGRQGFFFRFWKEVEKGRHDDWTPCFIPVYRTLKKYSLPIKANVDFHLTKEEQAVKAKVLKKDGVVLPDEHFNWKRAMIRKFVDLTGSEWDFYGEYPSNADEAFQGTGIGAFPRRLLHDIQERDCIEPKWIGEIVFNPSGQGSHQKYKLQVQEVAENEAIPEQEGPGTRLHIWEMPNPEDSYYLGVDVSEGDSGSGDFSSIQVIKIGIGPAPDEQVAEWHGYMNPTPLGDVCTALGYMYNTAQVSIECNGVGISTNNQLWRINEYDNVYQWKHIDKIKNFITNTVGWYTNQKTRDLIITKTREAIMERTLILRSYRLVDQMLDFAKEEGSSKYEGQDCNDDRVFGLMICRYCSHESDYGKNAMAQPMRRHANVDCWVIYDPSGRKVGETKDYDQAFGFIVTKAGYSMRPMVAKNKVTWIVSDSEGKKVDEIDDFDVARRMCVENKYYMRQSVSHVDFQNTDFSLVHDRQGGIHQKLYEKGIAPEEMRGELLLHAQMADGPPSDEEQSQEWKNW